MKLNYLLFLILFSGTLKTINAQPQLELRLFSSGFDNPVGIVNAGDDRMFIVQQRGHINIINSEGNVMETPFLDLSDVVSQSGFETGLLGLAFHPEYSSNGYFFVNYTRGSDGHTVVSRFSANTSNPDQAVRESELQLFTVAQPYSNHNGGQLLFGPDGFLYIALGDGGSAGDPGNNAQNRNTMLGKILRIDVNVPEDSTYLIPLENPFVNDETTIDEIWALGLRNPWRNSFDRYTGDFWIADVGQGDREEINFQPAGSNGGENYGWRCYEGSLPFNPQNCQGEENYIFPVFEYNHQGNGCTGSVTGGYVYRGAVYNGMFGIYIFADYCTGNVYSVTQNSSGFEGSHIGNFGVSEISSFGEDNYGEIYVAKKSAGEIYKIIETGDCNPVAIIMATDSVIVIEPDSSVWVQTFFNPALKYQWVKEDELLIGATQHEIEITGEGNYKVHVTNVESGCTNISDAVKVTTILTSARLKKLNRIKIFPNPVTNNLRIEGLRLTGESRISLIDSKGIVLKNFKGRGDDNLVIPVNNYPSGIYYLRIVYEGEVFIEKIMVNAE